MGRACDKKVGVLGPHFPGKWESLLKPPSYKDYLAEARPLGERSEETSDLQKLL